MLGYDQHCRKFTLKAGKNSATSRLCRISLCKEPESSDGYLIDVGACRIEGVPCRLLCPGGRPVTPDVVRPMRQDGAHDDSPSADPPSPPGYSWPAKPTRRASGADAC